MLFFLDFSIFWNPLIFYEALQVFFTPPADFDVFSKIFLLFWDPFIFNEALKVFFTPPDICKCLLTAALRENQCPRFNFHSILNVERVSHEKKKRSLI